jgi:uncharacterized membrane protein YhaH (DUF805 family)
VIRSANYQPAADAFFLTGGVAAHTNQRANLDTQHRIGLAMTMTVVQLRRADQSNQVLARLFSLSLGYRAWSSAAAFLVVMSQRPGHPALWVVAPFVFIPFASIKRLHDRAKSGSWMIGFLLPAWVLNLASEFVDRSAIAGEYWISLALSIAANAFLVWGLVAWTDVRHDRRQSIRRSSARSVA